MSAYPEQPNNYKSLIAALCVFVTQPSPTSLSQPQPMEFPYLHALDYFPEETFGADGEFDFDFGTDISAVAYPRSFEPPSQKPIDVIGHVSVSRAASNASPDSSSVPETHPSLSIDPAQLLLPREGARQPVSDLVEVPRFTPSGDAHSSLEHNGTQPESSSSARLTRRQRSPTPPLDHQQRIAAATFCFHIEIPDQPDYESRRPSKRARIPNDEQRRREIAVVRKKRACLRCHMQKLTVCVITSIYPSLHK